MTPLRLAAALALSVMFALLASQFAHFLGLGVAALRWPYELDYGEGIVWQQANMMLTPQAYGPIDGFPAIVFHYPPLYHLAARALAAFAGIDMLMAGRAVAIGSTLLTAGVVGLILAGALPAHISRLGRFLAGMGGALTVFCFVPIIFWALLMRVDMAADLFSLVGFWLGLKAFRRPALVYAAALCFVAAVYTKQTSLAAPAALFALMLWLRPRLALAGIATCIAVGLAALAALYVLTDGGFVRHVFFYNINRFEWSRLGMVLGVAMNHSLLVGVALITLAWRTREIRRHYASQPGRRLVDHPPDLAWTGIVFYFMTASLMLITVAKSGSSINYLIEWLLVMALMVGVALTDAVQMATRGGGGMKPDIRLALAIVCVPLFVAGQAWRTGSFDANISQFWSEARGAQMAALSARVRAAPKPIISDDMVIVLRSGKAVVWEPAIFAELASMAVWDERPFIKRIRQHEFSMFLTAGRRGDTLFDSRYNPAVAAAIDEAYPLTQETAGLVLHLPAAEPPSTQ